MGVLMAIYFSKAHLITASIYKSQDQEKNAQTPQSLEY